MRALLLQALQHAEDWGNADAPCEQDRVFGALLQPEMVARSGESHKMPNPQFVVDEPRPAATVGIAFHRDGVTIRCSTRPHQRILAEHSVWQRNIDVSSGLDVRERSAVGPCKLINVYIACSATDGGDVGAE